MTDMPTPRRTRRSDRYREEAAPAAPSLISVEAPKPPAAPAAEAAPAKAAEPVPAGTSAQQYTRRRAVRHTPADMTEQPTRQVTPVRSALPAEASASVQPMASAETAAPVPRPRKLPQPTPAAYQPPAPPVMERPRTRRPDAPDMMERPRTSPGQMQRPPRAQARPRMPLWMSVTLVVLVFVLAGLFTAKSLMEAYLVTRQQERQASYQRVVDAHPIYFKHIIEQYAEENNLHPAFVAAIILNESSYRTDAVSSVGARGLMQLMPDTAEWIAHKLNVSGYSYDRMFDAESNIRFGTWYLGYLAKLFRGDPVLVAAAYHTGQGEVTSWLSDRSMSEDGVTIALENMIDGPTKAYARRVTQAYAIYEALFYRPTGSDAAVSVYADAAGS